MITGRKSSQRRHMSSQLHHGEKCHPSDSWKTVPRGQGTRVKGLEHQWERPPATHGSEWNNCLLPACGAFMAKGCLILMASSHGALYLSIRNKEPPQLPPHPHTQHSPAVAGLGGALSTSAFWYHISQKVNGNILKSMLNFKSKSDLKFTSALRHFWDIYKQLKGSF